MNRIIQLVKENDLVKIALIGLVVYFFVNYTKKQEGLDMLPAYDVNYLSDISPQQSQIDSIVAGKDQLTADDLLPKYDEQNAFAQENPVSKLLQEKNFLISGFNQGITTNVSNHKIGYHDLRGLPYVISKENVGPWNQSSYDQPAGADIKPLII
jgi:hypothetical protein